MMITEDLQESTKKRRRKRVTRRLSQWNQSPSMAHGIDIYCRASIRDAEEAIPIEQILPSEYAFSIEYSSFGDDDGQKFVAHGKWAPLNFSAIATKTTESRLDHVALKANFPARQNEGSLNDGLIRKPDSVYSALGKSFQSLQEKLKPINNGFSIANRSEQMSKERQASLTLIIERITAEVQSRRLALIRSFLAETIPKLREKEFEVLKSEASTTFATFLEVLQNGNERPLEQTVDAVLEIQCMPIPEVLKNETLGALVDFIRNHRATNSQKILIAVGAAIRKVLLNLPASDIGLAAELMKSEGSLAVPIGVELEIAKMVVQRIIEDPSINASLLPELADALLSNARLYSTPKMVNREFYNATALNSVLACVLMRSPESQLLSNQILNDSPSWFSRLCSNRLKRIRNELLAKKDSMSLDLVNHLNSLPFLADSNQKHQVGSGS